MTFKYSIVWMVQCDLQLSERGNVDANEYWEEPHIRQL